MPKSPEQELEEFLSSLPTYRRKAFESGISSLAGQEMNEYIANIAGNHILLQEYERLVERIPAKLSEYRKREIEEFAQIRASSLPANPEGRPRKDALAEEAGQLKSTGLSYAQIANLLNSLHGEGTTSKENIRGLLKSRRLATAIPPEKT